MKLLSQTILLNPKRKLNILDDHEITGIIGIFGPSGCGKTSFLEYLYHHYRKEKMAYMKQDIFLHPELTLHETLWFYTALRQKKECDNISTVLEKMGMCHLSDRRVEDLSGGEKKRIMIAYHLLDQVSGVLLLDEPFSGIDPSNTDLIFSLLREKAWHCSILFTAHHLASPIQQQLDEKWTFVPSAGDGLYQLEIAYNQEDTFSNVSLDSTIQSIHHLTTSVYGQWKYLFLRDRILDKRRKPMVVMRWSTPLLVVLLQHILIGSFPKSLKDWEKTQNQIDLFKTFILHTILLFTVSIIPIHILNDHFHRRPIIQHEIQQGIYRRNAYFFSAILWDQLSLVLISLCVVLVLMPPDPFFATTFLNITMEMIFTNMLMWFCSAFPRSSFNSTLVLISTYISIAFLGNMGILLRHKSMKVFQYISMTHLQSNLWMEELYRYYPQRTEQLGSTICSLINLHARHRYWEWVLFSVGVWIFLPIGMWFVFSCGVLNNSQ